jgi:hypothetical protein
MRHRALLLALIVVQTVLLIVTTSALAGRGILYGCPLLCGSPGSVYIPRIAALFGIVMFTLPGVIGALCRGWQGAIALAVAPWWITVLVHAGTLVAPSIGLGGIGGRFGVPFWLDSTRSVQLVLSLALFALLGWLGWLTRHALRTELAANPPV